MRAAIVALCVACGSLPPAGSSTSDLSGGGLVNGDFETGNLEPWYAAGAVSITRQSHQGAYAMQVGDAGRSTTATGVAQEFIVPKGHARVTFFYRPHCTSKIASCTIQVMDASGTVAPVWAMSCGGFYGPCATEGSWTQATTRDLASAAGQKFAFRVSIDGQDDASAESYVEVDDVQLVSDEVHPSLVNGSFESLQGWSVTNYAWTTADGHSGKGSAALGTIPGDHALTQVVTVPKGHPVLSFWFLPHCQGQGDSFSATIGDTFMLQPTCIGPQWMQASYDMTFAAGKEISLQFLQHNGQHGGPQSWTEIDDVTLAEPQQAVVLENGSFESGNLGGWTATGSARAMSDLPHSGTWSAMLGDFSPTGDSTLSQSFTVPPEGGTLSFWYFQRCPDLVEYDWATATLTDVSTGAVTTLLPRTCADSGGYVQVSADLAANANHEVTLTLTNHDDGWPGDATFTYFDDISLRQE